MLFDVLAVSVFGFSLFRSCPFKSYDERRGIGVPVVFGSLESMPSHVGSVDCGSDTLRQLLSLSALFEVHHPFPQKESIRSEPIKKAQRFSDRYEMILILR
jgi:hypothetical protein